MLVMELHSPSHKLTTLRSILLSSQQIAPFHVELSVRETGLDFSKLRSAAVSLFTTKRPRDLIALNSNNALLEFLLEGSPEVKLNRIPFSCSQY